MKEYKRKITAEFQPSVDSSGVTLIITIEDEEVDKFIVNGKEFVTKQYADKQLDEFVKEYIIPLSQHDGVDLPDSIVNQLTVNITELLRMFTQFKDRK